MVLSHDTLICLRNIINDLSTYRSGPQLIKFFAEIDSVFNEPYGPNFGSRKEYTDRTLAMINGNAKLLNLSINKALGSSCGLDSRLRHDLLVTLNEEMFADGCKVALDEEGLLRLVPLEDQDRHGAFNPEGYARECFAEVPVEEDEDSPRIHNPFNPERIDIATDRQAVSNIVAMISHEEIDLRPAFQRSGNLWDAKKQSRLIESLLLKIPLPAFYFDDDSKNRKNAPGRVWQVIDGLQRLCAINNFIVEKEDSQRKLRLIDLEFLSDFEGRTYEQLPYECQRTINETQLTTYLVRKDTPPNVKFNIFKRVNTGGVPLTQQEIRHALHQGVASEFLKDLADTPEFKSATNSRIPTSRMLDRELVNRYLAFLCLNRSSFDDLESFLDSILDDIESTTDEDRADIKNVFCEVMRIAKHLFGKYAFCKLDSYPKIKPINKVLFEVVSVTLAKLSSSQRTRLLQVDAEKAFAKFLELFKDETYEGLASLISTTTGTLRRIEQRYALMDNYFQNLVDSDV